jgi:ribosomal protein L7Ae-like RNA K-turn-binding protein
VTPEVTRKLLALAGLGYRARNAVVGVQMVRDAAMRGRLKFAIVAPDVSRHSLAKLVPLLTAKRIRFVQGPSAVELGRVVGRESTAVIGVLDGQLARGMRALLEAAGADTAQGKSAEDAR